MLGGEPVVSTTPDELPSAAELRAFLKGWDAGETNLLHILDGEIPADMLKTVVSRMHARRHGPGVAPCVTLVPNTHTPTTEKEAP